MSNLMTSMYTGVSGLRVNQSALNTTAHNIANVDTKGFTRQQVLAGDFSYLTVGQSYISSMQVGLGTDMQIIRQVRDAFADKGYRTESGRLAFYEQQKSMVEEIENVFGELEGAAFKNTLTSMWEAMSALASEPGDIAKRGIVVSTAKVFLNRAQTISTQLQEYQKNLNSQIQEKVDRVNAIGDRIKELNKIVQRYEGSGQQANDYRDERNQLLDELSKIVKCTYEEDTFGVVTVNVEGVQFVTSDQVFHMATEHTVTEHEKEKAKAINNCMKEIYSALENGDPIADIKGMDEWKELSKYGNLSIVEDKDPATGNPTGITRVMFNEIQLMQYDNNNNAGEMIEYLSKQSELLNVVWTGNGCGDVFKLNGEYNSAMQTDIGGLKGLMVARGSYTANYSDIPKESDYLKADGTVDTVKYKQAVDTYNKYVDSSVLVSIQAQFDQLVHSLVTTINDILSPNMKLTENSVVDLFGLDQNTVTADQAKNAVIKSADGTVYQLSDNLMVLDVKNASTGMDENKTVGEALFNRKNKDRYTEATMTVEGTDENGNPKTYEKKVYIYNQEYDTDPYSLFTIDQIEINNEIANDYSKLPLSYNQYSGLLGGFDMKTCQKLLDAWDVKGLKLDPNTLTTNNFQDYYTSMISSLANRGNVYNKMVSSQEDVVSKFENARQEVAGVSSDDELTNLIKYQHAYNASSRYINAINEMLEHLVTRL
ncbi:flagellar hook-associated protein FlgK [Velocimicrobium porci]|uniref:Flagellar hook-associated protein 1 n=1 Tax=Velocimicrobium porci TaxID=2606634 RepID=A0A6L5XYD1_9FIRM|nr:flagellar hook-associated protein FlgK [Velocimicrobium porci]MSS63876.1 flagellar hook-associated protein FlgK [Velocimicrobium porci]